ncbi:MAG TPA: hypothetical protein VGL32_06015, partial [Acidimicrobiales bacterium]
MPAVVCDLVALRLGGLVLGRLAHASRLDRLFLGRLRFGSRFLRRLSDGGRFLTALRRRSLSHGPLP